jgi:hypothetical protein
VNYPDLYKIPCKSYIYREIYYSFFLRVLIPKPKYIGQVLIRLVITKIIANDNRTIAKVPEIT